MLDLSKLSSHLLADLRARLSPSSLEDDTTADDKIADLTPERAFHYYCDYNGLINHSDNLIRTIDSLRAAETPTKTLTEEQLREAILSFISKSPGKAVEVREIHAIIREKWEKQSVDEQEKTWQCVYYFGCTDMD